jgi:hypothetical protein
MDSSNLLHTIEEEGNVSDFSDMFGRMMDFLCVKIEEYPCDIADVDKMYHSHVRNKAAEYKASGVKTITDVVEFNINRFSIVVHWSAE